MSHYIITITRQFGSLGRPIAKKMSEILNVEYYDRDIVEVTAKNLNLPVSVISDAEETAKKGAFFSMKFPLGNGTSEVQDQIFAEQAKIIQEICEKESCIIVGRCSDYILRNTKNCINIFIYAPYEVRLRNCVDILHMEKENAKKMIGQVDEARDNYHMNFAKFLPSDYHYKDIMIDSSILGIEGTAKALSDIVKARFEEE